MAFTYSLLLLFSILISFFLASTSPLSYEPFSQSSSSSSVASSQLKFWSNNVKGSMPKTLYTKLSPLSIENSSYFASLLFKKSFMDLNFCSQANLACSSSTFNNYDEIQNGYNGYAKTRLSENKKKLDPHSFFRMSVLKQGNHVEIPNLHDHFPPRSFLPYEIASRISFKSDRKGGFVDQEFLHKLFPESFSSPTTKDAIRTTLLYCSSPSLKGERKSCPKSLEEMVEFVSQVLGRKSPKVALTSKNENGSGKKLVIGKVKKFRAEKFVACHEVFLPFATYLCHLLSSTYLYSLDFFYEHDGYKPENALPVNRILAICHLDTSEWPKDHVAFKVLKSSPGKGEACHFLTQIDLVWVPLLEGGFNVDIMGCSKLGVNKNFNQLDHIYAYNVVSSIYSKLIFVILNI